MVGKVGVVGLVWFGFGLVLVWFGLVWFGLVWFGLVWFGLVWFGLVWFGLVWFGLVVLGWLSCFTCQGQPDPRYPHRQVLFLLSGRSQQKENKFTKDTAISMTN